MTRKSEEIVTNATSGLEKTLMCRTEENVSSTSQRPSRMSSRRPAGSPMGGMLRDMVNSWLDVSLHIPIR